MWPLPLGKQQMRRQMDRAVPAHWVYTPVDTPGAEQRSLKFLERLSSLAVLIQNQMLNADNVKREGKREREVYWNPGFIISHRPSASWNVQEENRGDVKNR